MNITYIADGQRFTSMFALQKYADSVGEKVLSEERISSSVYKVTLIKLNHNAMNTPTPFERFGLPSVTKRVLDKKHTCQIISQGNGIVADVFGKTQQETLDNAELIVRAVNYHDRMVDMVEQLRADLKAARSALYIVGRLQEAQINSKSIQYSEQLLTEIKESK